MKHNRLGVRLLACLAGLGLILPSPLSAEEPKERVTFKGHTEPVRSVAFSPDDKTLASASGDGTIPLWDVQTGKELKHFHGHRAGINCVAYSPDGKTLASGGEDGTIKLWGVTADKLRD